MSFKKEILHNIGQGNLERADSLNSELIKYTEKRKLEILEETKQQYLIERLLKAQETSSKRPNLKWGYGLLILLVQPLKALLQPKTNFVSKKV